MTHVQQQLVELGIIVDGDVTRPELVQDRIEPSNITPTPYQLPSYHPSQERIEPSYVAAVQRLATVSVADAARALAELGDSVAGMSAAEAVGAACSNPNPTLNPTPNPNPNPNLTRWRRRVHACAPRAARRHRTPRRPPPP